MEIEITQELLDEINMFINTRAIQILNDDAELSFLAMDLCFTKYCICN